MRPKNEHLPLFDIFSEVCQRAYGSWHLVTSPELAKVGLADLFHEYVRGVPPPQPSKLFLLSKLLRYYAGGCVNFFLLVCCKIAHALSGQQTVISQKQTVFIDTYFIISNFLKGDDVLDHYFPGIKRPIADAGWEHVMLPRFYGTRNLIVFYRIFRLLLKYKLPVLTEFQILNWIDYLYVFLHMLIYPWLVIGLLKSIPRTREGFVVRFALINGLNGSNLEGAVRYFFGRRLTPVLPEKACCLQWFENQTFERCFNRGLREAGASMTIYGAQLFLWAPEEIHIHVDKNEPAAHKPDIILVNGPYYKHENIDVPCRVGPSLRYARLFETLKIEPKSDKKTLVILSQFEAEARFTIELAIRSEPLEKLVFKPHPTLNQEMLLPPESVTTEGNLYDALCETGLVIGSASGALTEAAAVGIPVIVVKKKDAIMFAEIPDIGRGLLWEVASHVKQLQEVKAKLQNAVLYKKEERLAAVERLRSELFTRPTSVAVVEMLDLLN